MQATLTRFMDGGKCTKEEVEFLAKQAGVSIKELSDLRSSLPRMTLGKGGLVYCPHGHGTGRSRRH